MKQSDLEQEMVKLGQERYHSKVSRATELNIESTHPAGQRLLQNSVSVLADHFKDWIHHAQTSAGKRHTALPLIELVSPQVAAAVTARATLDAISNGRKLTATAATVGSLIEDEVKYVTLKDEYSELWAQMNRNMNRHKSAKNRAKFIDKTLKFHEIYLPIWKPDERIRVGMVCIELMRQATGLIDIVARKNQHGKSEQWVEPTTDLLDWFKGAHAYMELLDPVFLPMIEKPQPWLNVYVGGYSSDTVRRRPLIKTIDKTHLDTVAITSMPKVYRALNAVQATPYRVNMGVLDTMQHCWDKGLAVDGLVSAEDEPLPPKPHDIKTNEEARKLWRRRAAKQHFDNERQRSRRIHALRVLGLSHKFKNRKLYYPLTMDFRGRGYPQPYFLQPQGPSFARSLFEFANPVKMTPSGEQWLHIHCANCYGMDKKSYEDRIKWAEQSKRMLTKIGRDPIGNMDWTEADDPWFFLAACQEFARMMDDPSFMTTLPVGIDATNQGLQIYALMLRDKESALATNCLPCDTPNDLYQQVSDTVLRLIEHDQDEYAKGWRTFGLDRKTCKRQTMTLPYGSTYYSCKQYTAEWFYDELKKGRENPFGQETYKPCIWLAEKIWEAIGMSVHAAREGMAWLQEVAATCIDNDVVPQWSTPLGLPVRMHYEKQAHLNIKTNVFGVIRQARIRTDSGEPSRRKSCNAMAPNVVHSIDGYGGILGESINLAMDQGVTDFLMVHDNFEVHATNVAVMGGAARQATINIFSGNLLSDLHREIQYLLPSGVALKEPPPQGELDISLIKQARYYFS